MKWETAETILTSPRKLRRHLKNVERYAWKWGKLRIGAMLSMNF
jgi:hypothetical protein